MAAATPEKVIPTHIQTYVGCRFNSAEMRGLAKFQKKLGFEGHGAQSKCVYETLRAAMKSAGCLGQLPE